MTPPIGTARIIRGDATHLPLDDESVDLVITSPPYFGLRSYQDGGQHYTGQLGDEPTPTEYVDNLITATREMIRVLKPTGSIWVNLGDKYTGGGGQWDKDERPDPNGLRSKRSTGGVRGTANGGKTYGLKPKSLIGIPWRYALRCVDDLGLILRAEIIWSKPNGLPESVTDRVRRSHETWFHLVKQPRYYSAIDHIREDFADQRPLAGMTWQQRRDRDGTTRQGEQSGTFGHNGMAGNPLGKLPGSVWEIPTQPLTIPDHLGVDHYAAFPIEWPRRIIAGWSPPGICTACQQGRRPTVEKEFKPHSAYGTGKLQRRTGSTEAGTGLNGDGLIGSTTAVITGYACDCPTPTAPTTPSVVLDPFGGTGTTALTAKAQGRHGITLDMSADYCRLAEWRTTDPGQLASAMQVDKPSVQHDGQLDLLEGFFA